MQEERGPQAMVALQVRIAPEESAAIDRVAPRGWKTGYVRELIRRDLIRRGELPEDKPRRHR